MRRRTIIDAIVQTAKMHGLPIEKEKVWRIIRNKKSYSKQQVEYVNRVIKGTNENLRRHYE